MFSTGELQALKNMLEVKNDDEDDDISVDHSRFITPASIGPQPAKEPPKKEKSTKDIWDADDLPLAEDIEDETDMRPEPEYEVILGQGVKPEDMFLGISGKTALSYDHLVIKVNLPGESLPDIVSNVTKTRIRITAKRFKLNAFLPKPVRHDDARAQWDPKKGLLTIRAPLIPDEFSM